MPASKTIYRTLGFVMFAYVGWLLVRTGISEWTWFAVVGVLAATFTRVDRWIMQRLSN